MVKNLFFICEIYGQEYKPSYINLIALIPSNLADFCRKEAYSRYHCCCPRGLSTSER